MWITKCQVVEQTNLPDFLVDIVQDFIHFLLVPPWILEFFIIASLTLLTIQLEP